VITSGALVLAGAGAFLLGAIPFSWILARLFCGLDIRTVGSGNVGATNVARSLGYGIGVAALLLDAAKGVAAVLLARYLFGVEAITAQATAGGLAVLGHNFTPFLGFRGGKGVATGAGVLGTLAPPVLLICLGVFTVTVALSRMVALGSVLASAALPPVAWLVDGHPSLIALAFLLAALVIIRHRGNLSRMMSGRENRLGGREKT
jgi:glycerol-3-phosphate acyltransferase PlsY